MQKRCPWVFGSDLALLTLDAVMIRHLPGREMMAPPKLWERILGDVHESPVRHCGRRRVFSVVGTHAAAREYDFSKPPSRSRHTTFVLFGSLANGMTSGPGGRFGGRLPTLYQRSTLPWRLKWRSMGDGRPDNSWNDENVAPE
jgi:hypothetical protein